MTWREINFTCAGVSFGIVIAAAITGHINTVLVGTLMVVWNIYLAIRGRE